MKLCWRHQRCKINWYNQHQFILIILQRRFSEVFDGCLNTETQTSKIALIKQQLVTAWILHVVCNSRLSLLMSNLQLDFWGVLKAFDCKLSILCYATQFNYRVIRACCRCSSVLTAALCCSAGTWRWSCLVASPLCVWWWSWPRSCPHLPTSSWHTAACVPSVWEVVIRHEHTSTHATTPEQICIHTQHKRLKLGESWDGQVLDTRNYHLFIH